MRMVLGWESERESEQANDRTSERTKEKDWWVIIHRRLFNAWLSHVYEQRAHHLAACLPASQPLCPNPHLQLIGCVRLLHVQTRSCEHASWQRYNEIFGTHTHKHIRKSLQMWSHAVWRKRKNWNKNRPNERTKERKCKHVYWCTEGTEEAREREKVCKHIHTYTHIIYKLHTDNVWIVRMRYCC